MVGFSDIDRQFQRRAPATIRLECLNCGGSDDTVKTRRPKWFNAFNDLAMCDACGDLILPTAAALIKERSDGLFEYYKTQPPAQYDGN